MSETLDAIRIRAKAYAEHGTPGLAAPKDRAALLRILADREAELLDIKGPCGAPSCALHYAHRGPCNREATL